jgi:four helix bundle protein
MSKLESLDAWKVSRALATSAYRLTLEEPLSRHFGLSDQIRRSAVSIPANIAEGYGLGTPPQLRRMLRIALGSAFELKCHLEIAVELKLVVGTSAMVTVSEADRVISLLIGLLKSVGNRTPTRPKP